MSCGAGKEGEGWEGKRYKVEGPGGDLPATHYYYFLLWLAASRLGWILELPRTSRCQSSATAVRGEVADYQHELLEGYKLRVTTRLVHSTIPTFHPLTRHHYSTPTLDLLLKETSISPSNRQTYLPTSTHINLISPHDKDVLLNINNAPHLNGPAPQKTHLGTLNHHSLVIFDVYSHFLFDRPKQDSRNLGDHQATCQRTPSQREWCLFRLLRAGYCAARTKGLEGG
jgi:hypothetical protein